MVYVTSIPFQNKILTKFTYRRSVRKTDTLHQNNKSWLFQYLNLFTINIKVFINLLNNIGWQVQKEKKNPATYCKTVICIWMKILNPLMMAWFTICGTCCTLSKTRITFSYAKFLMKIISNTLFALMFFSVIHITRFIVQIEIW